MNLLYKYTVVVKKLVGRFANLEGCLMRLMWDETWYVNWIVDINRGSTIVFVVFTRFKPNSWMRYCHRTLLSLLKISLKYSWTFTHISKIRQNSLAADVTINNWFKRARKMIVIIIDTWLWEDCQHCCHLNYETLFKLMFYHLLNIQREIRGPFWYFLL